MRENLIELYKVFYNNQPLLKLLNYPSTSYYDDPLAKPDITDRNIKNDLIKRSIVVDDLTVERNKGRVLIYPNGRYNTSNYIVAKQAVNIDILVPIKMDEVDFRLAWVCDHVNSLLHDERITGLLGKVAFRGGTPIRLGKDGYVGYQLSYEFGSAK
jgi:hypothetical protein